jgi:hypothetical protein
MKSIKTLLAAVALLSFQCAVFSAGVVTNTHETTLRNALAGGGTVTFECDGVIVLSNTIVIATDTVLDGSGHSVTISGNGAIRIFTVNTNVNFVLKNLVLANGFNTWLVTDNLSVAGPATGGALCSTGTVQIVQCVFSNNVASGTNTDTSLAGPGLGGAIFNVGTLFVNDTCFVKNSACGTNDSAGGFGSTGAGGAIYNLGTLVASNSLFIGNAVLGGAGTPNEGYDGAGNSYGGAIYNSNNATIFNCTFSSNSATGGKGTDGNDPVSEPNGGIGGAASGAGIYNSDLLSVFNTTFVGNTTFGGAGGNCATNIDRGAPGASPVNGGNGGSGGNADGGGISSSNGVVTIVNTTFFNNSAIGGAGRDGANGLDYIDHEYPPENGGNGGNGGNGIAGGASLFAGTIYATNDTFSGNVSFSGTIGLGGHGGAGLVNYYPHGSPGLNGTNGLVKGANLAATNGSLVLKNTIVSGPLPSTNAYGTIIDGGCNLSSDASCSFTNVGSVNAIDPLLGPLANNGGPTETCALLSGSPAIDAITDGSYPATDQRGFSRPFGSAGDIGAVEYYSGAFVIHSLTPNNNEWQIAGTGFPSTAYRLQASTNLKSWFTVETNVTRNDGFFKSVDATATNSTSQFYRISVP